MHTFLRFLRKYTPAFCLLFFLWGGNVFGQIAAWDFNGESSPATSTADIYNTNLDSSNLITRGAAATASAGSNSFRTTGFQNNGISTSNTDYFEITLSSTPGNNLSLSTIDARFAGTSTFAESPGVSNQFAYSLNGTTFVLIASPQVLIGSTSTLTQINLSGISALQNVPASTIIYIRYYASGQTTTGGWGFNSPAAGQYGLAIGGTVTPAGKVSVASGNWNTDATWNPAGVPTATDNVTIASGHNVTIDSPVTRNAGTTTTVTGTLSLNSTYTNNGTTTINGDLRLFGSAVANTGNDFVYGTSGRLDFRSLFTVTNSDKYWPADDVTRPKSVTINTNSNVNLDAGVNRVVPNTFAVLGTISFPSSTLTLNGTVDMYGTGIINHPPIYGSSSLLHYVTGTKNRTAEWSANTSGTIGVTPGYPNNVTVANSVTLNMPNGPDATFSVHGNLTVISNATLNQNAGGGSAALNIRGNVEVNGTLTLGSAIGGDITVGGNWTQAGTLNPNSRAVIFNGTGNQTIQRTGGGTIDFAYLQINKDNTTNVSLSNVVGSETSISISANVGNVFSLTGSGTGGLNLNGQTLTFNNAGGNIYTTTLGKSISSAVANGRIEINGAKTVANNAGTGSLILDTNITVNLNPNGNINFGAAITTLNGILSINSTTNCFVSTNPPIYGSASTLVYNNVSPYGVGTEWNSTGFVVGLGAPNDVTLVNSTVNLPAATRGIARNLSIGTNSTLNGNNNNSLLIAGNWNNAGVFTANGGFVSFRGSNAQTLTNTNAASSNTERFFHLLIDKGSGSVRLDSDVTIFGNTGNVLRILGPGTLNLNGKILTLENDGGNILAGGTTAGSRIITSSVPNGRINITGAKGVGTANSFTLTLDASVTVNLNPNGNINFGANLTTLNGILSINSTTNCFVNTNPPIYGPTSTLIYNNVNGYGVSTEWNGNAATAGAGTPQNVTLTTSTITMPAASRALAGNLTIGSESFLNMSFTANADLRIGGNFNNSGTFTGNSRKVFFTGAINPQIITSSSVLTIPYIEFTTNAAATVQLAGDLVVSAPAAGAAITFANPLNVLNINGRTLTIGSIGTDNTISGLGTFRGSTSSNLTLLGNGSIGELLRFESSGRVLNTLTLNRQDNTIGFELGTDLTVANNLNLTNGIIDVGLFELTIGANINNVVATSTDFIIATSGRLRKNFTDGTGVARSFVFPIGNAIDRYSPATLAISTGNFNSGFVSLNVIAAKAPNNDSPTHFINRYWNVQGNGVTTATYSFSGDFLPSDIPSGANITSMKSGRWRASNNTWIQSGTNLSTNTVSFSSLTTTSDGAFDSLGGYNFTAGNPFRLAEMNIKQGITDIATGGTFDFGNRPVGSTITRTFTIENLGLEDLNLGAATITNSNATNYSLSSNYITPVLGNGTESFTISFTPTILGTVTGSISIPNNDTTGGENPYIVNFTSVVGNAAISDIVTAGGEPATISSIENDVAITTTADGTEVWRFTIRDGGGTSDLDTAATILNTLTITQGVGNQVNDWADAIQAVALFNGTTKIADGVVSGNQIVFTGSPLISVPDNQNLTLSLRLSIQTNPNNSGSNPDNDDFQFSITNANTALASGSQFNSSFPVATSTNDLNRLSVVATHLSFLQQPTNTSINAAMTPAVTVQATDINGNRDLDYTAPVTITSTGTLTGSPVSATTVVAGLATFSTLTHTVAGTGFTLSAASSGLIALLPSTTFNISSIIFVNGDFMSKTAGTWNINGTGTASWFKRVAGNWVDTTELPNGTSGTYTVYITQNVEVPVIGSSGSFATAKLHVMDNATFTYSWTSSQFTFLNVIIESGSTIDMVGRFTVSTSGELEVKDGGNFIYSHVSNAGSSSSLTSTLWNGSEKFHPNSNFIVRNHPTGNTEYFFPAASNLTANNFNGVTAYFGNLLIESVGQVRLATTNLSSSSIFLTHGNLEFKQSVAHTLLNGSGTWIIGKDLLYKSGSNGNLTVTTGNFNINLNVKGNFINSSTFAFRLLGNTSTGTITLNVDKDIILQSGSLLNLNATSPATGQGIVNLKGDLDVAATARLFSTVSGNPFNFIGTGDGLTDATTQTIDIENITTEIGGINFNVKSGAYVKLINQQFAVGSFSVLTVESGGTFDFGFNGTDPLFVSGANFVASPGSILKITSPDGITTSATGAFGNVQTSGRTYPGASPFGNFHYIGKGAQSTGNGLPPNVNNLFITNEGTTNDLTLTQAVRVRGTLTMTSGNIVSTDTNVLEIGSGVGNKGSLTHTSGFVKGPLKRWFSGVNSGNASGLFPLGTPGNFSRHALIEYTTAPTAGALTVKFQEVNMGVGGLIPPPEIPVVGSCPLFNVLSTDDVYWGMTASDNLAGGLYTATITKQNGAATDADICRQTLLTGNALSWGVLGTHNASTGSPTNITLRRTGLNAIRDLGIGRGFCDPVTKIYAAASDWTTTPPTILDRIKVTGNYTIPANTTVSTCACEVDPNVTLTVSANATLAVVENVAIGTNALIDIKDSGSLVQYRNVDNATTNINVGNIRMERITKPMRRLDFTYWSSPIFANDNATVEAGEFTLFNLSPTTPSTRFYRWEPSATTTSGWIAVPPAATSMIPGKGYIVRAPNGFSSTIAATYTANFIGKPNNGVVNATVYGSNDTPTVAAPFPSWNLIGNPYPSALDADLFLDANTTNPNESLGGTLYFWTHNSTPGSSALPYNPDDYASYNSTGGVGTAALTGTASNNNAIPSGKIAAGQGFFVKGIKTTAGTFNAVFNNSMRVAGENNQFFKGTAATMAATSTTAPTKHRVWLNLTGATQGFNQTLVGYVQNATNGFDNRYDGERFGGNSVALYSVLDSRNLVIQGRALPFVNTDTVPLGYSTTLTGNLTISIDHVDGLMEDQAIYLQDNMLNVVHNLKESNYTFASVPGTFNTRFVLRYLPQENLSNPTFDEQIKAVTLYKNNATLYVSSPYESIAAVSVFDLAGRKIFEQNKVNSNQFETDALTTAEQVLIVKVTLVNGGVVTKKVAQ